MKNLNQANKSYSEHAGSLMNVIKAISKQNPQQDQLLITLLKRIRNNLDQKQKRFYLTFLIDY